MSRALGKTRELFVDRRLDLETIVVLALDWPTCTRTPAFSEDGRFVAWGLNRTVHVADRPEVPRRPAGVGLGW